jgi:hypothetical protein
MEEVITMEISSNNERGDGDEDDPSSQEEDDDVVVVGTILCPTREGRVRSKGRRRMRSRRSNPLCITEGGLRSRGSNHHNLNKLRLQYHIPPQTPIHQARQPGL